MRNGARHPQSAFLSDEVLRKARSLFPHTQDGKVYLNHASTAPMSIRVVESIEAHLRERSIGKIDTYLAHDVDKIEKCRARIASLINAESPDRIALLTNTSDAINVISSGLEWHSGDRVLLHEAEFPANVYPYMHLRHRGVEIDVIPQLKGHPTPELIADSLTPKTRLVAVSAIQFLTGYRADLAAIGGLCRDKGVLFVVDGIQSVGAMSIDVQRMRIDAMASGCQKWQMGPQGTAWLYLTDEMQSRIRQAHLGWLAVQDPWDFFNYNQPLAPTARRYEGGTKNIPGIWGLDAALATLLEFGTDAIEAHILALSAMLIDGLRTIDGATIVTPLATAEHGGIVTIHLAPTIDARGVFRHLLARDFTISLREGKLRYSPHFYNSPMEIALAVSATREALGRA